MTGKITMEGKTMEISNYNSFSITLSCFTFKTIYYLIIALIWSFHLESPV